MIISFEIDVSDLDAFHNADHNVVEFINHALVGSPMMSKMEALTLEKDPVMRKALIHHYDQEILLAKRMIKSIKIESTS